VKKRLVFSKRDHKNEFEENLPAKDPKKKKTSKIKRHAQEMQ